MRTRRVAARSRLRVGDAARLHVAAHVAGQRRGSTDPVSRSSDAASSRLRFPVSESVEIPSLPDALREPLDAHVARARDARAWLASSMRELEEHWLGAPRCEPSGSTFPARCAECSSSSTRRDRRIPAASSRVGGESRLSFDPSGRRPCPGLVVAQRPSVDVAGWTKKGA